MQPFNTVNFGNNMDQARSLLTRGCQLMTIIGNAFTFLGISAVILGMLGVFDMEIFSFGLSSGVRIIGSVAIAGCLLSAIGYGISDYSNK